MSIDSAALESSSPRSPTPRRSQTSTCAPTPRKAASFGQSQPTVSTVVFIHGTFGDLNAWGGQEALFAQGYRVLVYSRRYHPPNPPVEDNETYSPKLHAEDLAALLLTLDVAPAHIIGSSYGAYVALALARAHPELVRSLVLAEPPMFPLLSGSELGDSVRRAFFTNGLDPARRA